MSREFSRAMWTSEEAAALMCFVCFGDQAGARGQATLMTERTSTL